MLVLPTMKFFHMELVLCRVYNSGDGADCWHTEMSFTVEVELAQ